MGTNRLFDIELDGIDETFNTYTNWKYIFWITYLSYMNYLFTVTAKKVGESCK